MSRPYHRPADRWWFLRRRRWLAFIVRELTAVVIAAYLVFLLVVLARLGAGPEAFVGLLAALTHPLAIVAHIVALAGGVWHAVTWFNLTPQVMPVRIGVRRVPPAWVAIATGYAPWLLITALVIWGVAK